MGKIPSPLIKFMFCPWTFGLGRKEKTMLNNTNNTETNRAGIKPARLEKVYNLKTADAEAYLNKKLSAIPGRDGLVVNLFTLNLTDRFAPFVIALPMSVLEKPAKQKNNGEMMGVFANALNQSGSKSKTVVANEIFTVLKPYSFDNVFRTDGNDDTYKTIKANLGLSRTQCQMLDRTRIPHVETFADGKIKCVMMTIDPIFVFTDMLFDPNVDNRQYAIRVTNLRKIDEASAEYTVRKVPNSDNRGGNKMDGVAKEMVRRMGCR